MEIKTKKLYGLLRNMAVNDSYLLTGYQSNTSITAEVAKWNSNNAENKVKISQQQFSLVDTKNEKVGKA